MDSEPEEVLDCIQSFIKVVGIEANKKVEDVTIPKVVIYLTIREG